MRAPTPTSPVYLALAELCRELDDRAKTIGVTVVDARLEEAGVVDPQAISMVALQRGLRAYLLAQGRPVPTHPQPMNKDDFNGGARFGAAFLDGFILGLFAKQHLREKGLIP